MSIDVVTFGEAMMLLVADQPAGAFGIELGGRCFVEAHLALGLADEREFEIVDEDGEADFEFLRRRIVFSFGCGLMDRMGAQAGGRHE